ncbi:hypothetical protein ACFCW7_11065 [Paenibacillus glucanolyticus]|uniref:hypothetical protein n=1 Tax=Paenibacillus glucanolyticus TaxID=59843 RepID=UPI0035DCBBAF
MMKEIGQKVFYEKDTGHILVAHPSVQGDEAYVKDRTLDEIIALYPVLRDRDRTTFDVIELAYGELDEDFRQSSDRWVDPVTKQLKFVYRDPNVPEEPPVFRKPLTQEVDELNTTIGTLLLESAIDKATIASMEETMGTLLMEVATLKGGAV